jgi:uncharacterized protein
VRALGRALGLDVRFKPLLPLGRAAGPALAPEHDDSLDEDGAAVAATRATATCGLGMNLYVGPGGECYPCYALTGVRHALGNALAEGLPAVLARNDAHRRVTVDTNRGCRACALRYLCGGFCRAWGDRGDPDGALPDCAALQQRARARLLASLEALDVPPARWQAAGLPLER